jgi:hypothetical protein
VSIRTTKDDWKMMTYSMEMNALLTGNALSCTMNGELPMMFRGLPVEFVEP